MTIEVADYVGELDQTLPTDDNDFVFEGDDHFRLVKKTLIQSFPNILGIVNLTQDEMNALVGIVGNVEVRIAALEADPTIPPNAKMLFYADIAPAGWTIDTSLDDFMIRVVSGTLSGGGSGGVSGGVDSPILMDKVPTHTHIGTVNSAGNHNHSVGMDAANNDNNYGGKFDNATGATTGTQVKNTSTSGSHTHSFTSDPNGGASNWVPKYASMILCTRN